MDPTLTHHDNHNERISRGERLRLPFEPTLKKSIQPNMVMVMSGSVLSEDDAPLADYVLAGVLVTMTCVAVALAVSFFILA